MFLKLVFGVLAFAAIVASFVLGSNISRKGMESNQSSLVDKLSAEPVVKEKPSLPLPVERDEPKRLVISNTLPLTLAVESPAPSVELLAEFEISGITRSLKSSAIKSRMKDGVSSYSHFSGKDLTSKDQQGSSEFSAVNSNSSERSTPTTKKKNLGKELGSNDMVFGRNDEVITPLRRSARIRNRADVVPP
ncbi:uncharacterized protein LOC120169919 [Hibiscus syriacus]|uniref:uncharacterized protein LOC120169919 n=1 Tax=Hibiscus syriacus TaxID=106335 RepID=UPI001923035F|nr:uncharacterized protein LOC120169919 [Hibiscus syriacus]